MKRKASLKALRPAALLFTLLLTAAPLHAYTAKIDGIYYYFYSSTRTAEVTYYSSSSSYNRSAYTGSVDIPSTVKYDNTNYVVTSIGSSAFRNCTSLTKATI
ncbi:MAG: leucine-rich repeat domain-containing protein [Prevotellaceae bacterium]|nr:leucine-rich repeat domain-containing protein [Prevotellaceae bacterium]